MKQTSKAVALILAVLLAAGTFTGCVEIAVAVLTPIALGAGAMAAGETIVAISDANAVARTKKKAAAAGRKVTFNEIGYNGTNPFENEIEDRLIRRTSELEGGTPVDITPYLLHADSFAVIDDAVEYCKNVIEFNSMKEAAISPAYEFDMTLTYEVNNQKYQEKISALAEAAKNSSRNKNAVKSNLKQYVTEKRGVKAADIKDLKVKFDKTRKVGGQPLFKNVFMEDTESGYYQFDVDVEFQKLKPGLFKKVQTTDFATFSKVYRSDCTTPVGAALSVQGQIWNDARKNSKLDKDELPLPRINFVRVVKFTE